MLILLSLLLACGAPSEVASNTESELSADAELEALEALGYVTASNEAQGESGVVVHLPSAGEGLNLYTSADAPSAYLMDMDGKLLHTWTMPWETAFPAGEKNKISTGTEYFRRVLLLENGDLIAIYEGHGLVRLNKESGIVWAWPGKAHHDLELVGDELYVLSRVAHVLPDIHKVRPVLEDFVSVLDVKTGEEKRSVSVLRALLGTEFHYLYRTHKKPAGDLFHTNSLQVLDGTQVGLDPAFAKGNILTSSRAMHALMVLDMNTGKIVWAQKGPWYRQHDPQLFADGTMMVFDNMGSAGKSAVRVFEAGGMHEIRRWGSPENPLYTQFCGAASRLDNGDMLITESEGGRVLQVRPDDSVSWEFVSPHRDKSNPKLVAMLPELQRIPSEKVSGWLVQQ